MTRRSDIQFLRGVAVSLVVLFHLDIMPFRSGFIGVDVFFVISGFLMAVTLRDVTYADVTTFYVRRLKRIMPAYLFVLAALVALAPVLFIPPHVKLFYDDIPALLLGAPNIQMWLQTDYWRDSYFAPAMHFWSLGVELQFYLILPLILFAHQKNRLFTILLFFVSLVLCVIIQQYSAKSAFFLMPLRIWEFLAGFYLAKLGARNFVPRSRLASAVMFYGTLAVIIALAMIPMHERAFPWPWAVPVVMATVLLLASAYEAQWLPERALFKGVEYLGELSYSIYLVHFPVIVVLTYAPFNDGAASPPDLGLVARAIGLTLLLAMISYYAVERPLRRIRYPRPSLAYGVVGSFVAMSLLGPVWIAAAATLRPAPSREVAAVYAAMVDKSDDFRCSLMSLLTEPRSPMCPLNDIANDGRHPTVLVVGDSHADAIKEVLRDEATRAGVRLLLLRKNVLAGYGDARPEALVPLVREHRIGYLLLHSRTEQERVPWEITGLRRVMTLAEQETVKILFLEPVPTWETNVPAAVYRTLTAVKGPPLPYQDVFAYRQKNASLLEYVESVKSDRIARFSLIDRLCTPQCKLFDESGRLLYHDEHHLSLTGAQYVHDRIREIFQFVALDFQRSRPATSANAPLSD